MSNGNGDNNHEHDNPCAPFMSTSAVTQLATLTARMDALETSITLRFDNVHKRMDKIEEKVTQELSEIQADVKEILAWVNRSKGGLTTVLAGIGIIGGTVGALLSKLLGNGKH